MIRSASNQGHEKVVLHYIYNAITYHNDDPVLLYAILTYMNRFVYPILSEHTQEEINTALGADSVHCDDDDDIDVKNLRHSSVANVADVLSTYESIEFDGMYGQISRFAYLLQQIIGMTNLDRDILCCIMCIKRHRGLEQLGQRIAKKYNSAVAALACFLGVDNDDVEDALKPKGTLIDSGLLTLDPQPIDFEDTFDLASHVAQAAKRFYDDAESLRRQLLGSPQLPSLSPETFDHRQEDRDFLASILRQANLEQTVGVNILLYGPPGTGKTEFATLVARLGGLTAYAVGEEDEEGDEPSRGERLACLRTAMKLMQSGNGAAFVLDECEDVFDGTQKSTLFRRQSHSKVYMNRILECNRTPVIWIANDVSDIPDTIRRRMTAAVQLDVPAMHIREQIWETIAQREGTSLPEGERKRLAQMDHVPAGVAQKAVQAGRLAGQDHDGVYRAATGILKALNNGKARHADRPRYGGRLDQDLLSARVDVAALRNRLVATGRTDFSLCLHGPPGTGKSAYVRELAEALGFEVDERRVSDLISPLVGETEKNIAQAFEEARDGRSFLIFDEADSLLANRRNAHRTFEVTQVNELLSWMEVHPYPFACTTNIIENLDDASLRRFTFKIGFDYLNDAQKEYAFRQFFQQEPPAAVRDLTNLTPGDFVVAARKADILGKMDDPEELLQLVREEADAKGQAPNPIGFHLPGKTK